MSLSSGGATYGKRNKRRRAYRPEADRPLGIQPPFGETANRERVFQDLEGLLRRIREVAEESAAYSEGQVAEYAREVGDLFRALEGEGDVVSDRLFGAYQRLRRRLSDALKTRHATRKESRTAHEE